MCSWCFFSKKYFLSHPVVTSKRWSVLTCSCWTRWTPSQRTSRHCSQRWGKAPPAEATPEIAQCSFYYLVSRWFRRVFSIVESATRRIIWEQRVHTNRSWCLLFYFKKRDYSSLVYCGASDNKGNVCDFVIYLYGDASVGWHIIVLSRASRLACRGKKKLLWEHRSHTTRIYCTHEAT